MCGFIGFTQKKDIETYEHILRHRGPDYVSSYTDADISLLHNRLSIIDISDAAKQPMVDESNGNVIVYNGEIYNYRELRKRYNLDCRTGSDTEVILKLFGLLGKSFVNELKGIFALVIYDFHQKKLYAYRDRFGVKPFYYRLGPDHFSFASEIKALLEDSCEPNYQAIYNYLEFGLLQHDTTTFFEGIQVLEAAHSAEYDLSTRRFNISRYWDISDKVSDNFKDNEIIEKTCELLDEALKLNLVSDVEVAISLSSGTDSTLLTKLAKNHQQHFKAFTFGFYESDYDEVAKVKENFDLQELELFPVYLKKEHMLRSLQESIYYFETPLGGLGTLSAYNMMKEVKTQNIKVILAGEGSDEVFGGYRYYYPAFLNDLEDETLLRKELQSYNEKHRTDIQIGSQSFHNWLNLVNSNKVLAPDGTTASNSHCGPFFDGFKLRSENAKGKFKSHLHNIMYQDMFRKKLPKLLHFQDRASMASSIEARVPFLDHDLVSYIYSLPPDYKIKNGETKYLLKEVLRKKFDYTEARKTKHYVATPQREWLKDKNIRNEILDIIRNGKLVDMRLIDFNKFHTDYMTYSNSLDLGNSFFVWKIINLEFLLGQKWTLLR